MNRQSLGWTMLCGFVVGVVAALVLVGGWWAVVVIVATMVSVAWVVVAINLMTDHHPFSPWAGE